MTTKTLLLLLLLLALFLKKQRQLLLLLRSCRRRKEKEKQRRRLDDVVDELPHRLPLRQKGDQPPVEGPRLLDHVVLVEQVREGKVPPVEDGLDGGLRERGDSPEHGVGLLSVDGRSERERELNKKKRRPTIAVDASPATERKKNFAFFLSRRPQGLELPLSSAL